LLVLIAVLLPVRGTLAAVAHCAGGSNEPATVHAVGQNHDHAHHETSHGHTDAVEVHADAPADGQDPAVGDAVNCNLCTASCAATPFVSSAPATAVPLSLVATSFAALTAPPSSHASEGPERPPRSI